MYLPTTQPPIAPAPSPSPSFSAPQQQVPTTRNIPQSTGRKSPTPGPQEAGGGGGGRGRALVSRPSTSSCISTSAIGSLVASSLPLCSALPLLPDQNQPGSSTPCVLAPSTKYPYNQQLLRPYLEPSPSLPSHLLGATGHANEFVPNQLVRSILRQMSAPEHSAQTIEWKRLHLSRAKLKASSRTSALLSGFAMVAMVEVTLCDNSKSPLPFSLLLAFAVCTTLLVSVHMLALMISTCILPKVEAVSAMQGMVPVSESPHVKLSKYVELAWLFSTVVGILLFMVEVALLCWVKFWDIGTEDGTNSGKIAALVATIILIPVVVVFIAFAYHFYNKIVAHSYERTAQGLEELQTIMSQLPSMGADLPLVPECELQDTEPIELTPLHTPVTSGGTSSQFIV